MTTNRPEAERCVLNRLDGVSEIILIPFHYLPYETLITADGVRAELEKVSSKDVLYYKEVDNGSNSRGLFR